MLDIGTGSGVLCFVADLRGASYALGVEIDPDCRENIAENLRNNGPPAMHRILIGSTDAIRSSARFDLVVMNMLLYRIRAASPACLPSAQTRKAA